MLYRNDIFIWHEQRFRLLHANRNRNKAWAIHLDGKLAWPIELHYSKISDLQAVQVEEPGVLKPSNAMKTKRDQALFRVSPLVENVPAIFNPKERAQLIEVRSADIQCSERTLHKNLRRYWQGGQTAEALLANYHMSGRKVEDVTAGRGRPPKGEHRTYQLTPEDVEHFKKIIEKRYMKDSRLSMAATFRELLRHRYTYTDGNGNAIAKPFGSRPTVRQFQHFLNTTYSLEARIRGREGDKDFERNHRAVLGTVMADCLGAGHYYEIDATIADLFLVSSVDVNKIIGKPTLYLIVDRKSRLIVGFYLGLENACWISAMEAILSISMDKAELCARYGVEYDPEDWPAHCVFPKEFLADRGEMISKASTQVSDDLRVTVTNIPGLRPDWKPLVECGFKLIHDAIRDVAPAYDPPSNATKRRGKHYEKDACLTLRGFGNIILNAIIAHNRRAIRNYKLSLQELTSDIIPVPIALWNRDIVERSGLLTRYNETQVRHALLPRDEAAVTERGIVFRGCNYTCPEGVAGGWFVNARKKRFNVNVSFDSRLVDVIYVHKPSAGGQLVRATLIKDSVKYRGLSFAEVNYYERLSAALRPHIEQSRLQNDLEFHGKVQGTVASAKKKLRDERNGKSRTARRADIKEDRQDERRAERQSIAAARPSPRQEASDRERAGAMASVVPFPGKGSGRPAPPPTTTPTRAGATDDSGASEEDVRTPAKQTIDEIVRAERMKMLHG